MSFTLNHTMLRIRDPEVSTRFYQQVFDMRVLRKIEFPELEFTLYFLAGSQHIAEQQMDVGDEEQRTARLFSQRGILELTHNHGSEEQPDFRYHNGNDDPQGFGHICFSVPDLAAACRHMDDLGVEFVKRPEEGGLRDIAFVKDPDGYWIELVEPAKIAALARDR